MKRLLLVGAGHAHAQVLLDLAERFKAMLGQRYYFNQSRVGLNYTPLGSPIVPVGDQQQGYSNLLAAASFQQQLERFESCIDKAQRARIYIQEAQK